MRWQRSRFRMRLRHGFNRRAEAAEGATCEQRVLRGTNKTHGNVIRRAAIASYNCLRGLGAASEQASELQIVARNSLADFFEDGRNILVVERLTKTLLFELMRQNAKQIEIGARAHDLGS